MDIMQNTVGDALRRCRLFVGVSGDRLEVVERECRLRRFAAGDLIIAGPSTPEHGVFVVVEGTVSVVRSCVDGAGVLLAELGPYESFGEFATIDGRTGSATVTARSDCVLAELPRPLFEGLLHDCPEIAQELLRRLIALVRGLNERVIALHQCQDEADRLRRGLLLASL
jgi:CRP-like cAMP-binding protein